MGNTPTCSMVRGFALALAVLLGSPALAAEKVPLVVLPTHPPTGIDLSASTRKVLEPALARRAKIVSYKRYLKAAADRGIAVPKLVTKRAIKGVGADVGARGALIVEGIVKVKRVGKKRRKKKSVYARVALIDVNSGRLLFTQTYSVSGRAISNELAGRIAEATARHLRKIRIAPVAPKVAENAWGQTSPAALPAVEPSPAVEPKSEPTPSYAEVKTEAKSKEDPWSVPAAPVRRTDDPWAVPTQPAADSQEQPKEQGWGESVQPQTSNANPWAQPAPAAAAPTPAMPQPAE
ncbi:MAG: hypothetical protein VX834_10395, partial [Myxococcota bacterium]|nr:hypothetical protein [Myxococcota bacterium]